MMYLLALMQTCLIFVLFYCLNCSFLKLMFLWTVVSAYVTPYDAFDFTQSHTRIKNS